MKPHFLRLAACLAVIIAGMGVGPAAETAAASRKTILLLPFTINAAGDISYLKKGIEDMLASRLTSDQIAVQTAADSDPGSASPSRLDVRELARQAGADYVVSGSITIIGEHLSTDARCIQTETGDTPVQFSQTGSRVDDVIAHINAFSDRINQALTGSTRGPVGVAPVPAPPPADAPDIHQNPEKLIDEARRAAPGSVSDPGAAPAAALGGFTVWRSAGFDPDITGIDVGDVDGDGRLELIAITGSQANIYRFDKQRLAQAGAVPVKGRVKLFSVHVGDIRADGRAEIFLTQLDNRLQPFVQVYEWDGRQYARTAELRGWFLSTVAWPGQKGRRLIGQQKGNEGYATGIFEFNPEGSGYGPGQKLALPRNVSVHGFAWLPDKRPDAPALIAFTPSEYLRYYDSAGEVIWSSNQHYGGSTTYFDHEVMESPTVVPERTYINPKIHVVDVDGDGLAEIVVAGNEDSAGRYLSKIRVFRKAYMEILEAGLTGPRVKWKSEEISGHINDMAVGDLDGDGRIEIIAVIHPRNPLFEKKQKSFLLIWQKAAE